jgi:hypothetical protein
MLSANEGSDSPEIDARLRLALARIDRSLSESEIEQVRGKTGHLVALGEAMRRTPLQNGDEPAPPFDPAVAGASASLPGGPRDRATHAQPGPDGREARHDVH